MKPAIKVCGVTTESDAEMVVDAGATAVGLNLWATSPRSVSWQTAARIGDIVRGALEVICVCVDEQPDVLHRIAETVRPDRFQLHHTGPLGQLDAWQRSGGVPLYFAIGLREAEDYERALAAPGDRVLVDARDDQQRGGTGRAPPLGLARKVCAARPTILAGGLGPDNVAAAIATLRPAGVDAASGLEIRPGIKDETKVRDYVSNARGAFLKLETGDV